MASRWCIAIAIGLAVGWLPASSTLGQSGLVISQDRTGITAPIDLTAEAKSRCTESFGGVVRETSIEVRFPTGFSAQAHDLMRLLRDSLMTTQSILGSLHIENVRFYFLPLPRRPSAYTYNFLPEKGLYQALGLVIGSAPTIDCSVANSDLCEEIFSSMPHELTHGATHWLFSDSTTRWFEDGLAEYVAWRVADKLAPPLGERKLLTRYPKAALHCPEIRRKVLSWKHDGTGIRAKQLSDSKRMWETNGLYGAAMQLVRLILGRAENSESKESLPLLLTSLIDFRAQRGGSLSGNDLLAIVEKVMNVDVRQLGVLSPQEEKSLAADAVKT